MRDLIQRHLDRVESRQAAASHQTHRTNLRSFDSWLDDQDYSVTDLSALDLEDYFLAQKSEGYAPNTISSRFESVRALYKRLAGRFDAMEDNPFENLERHEFVDKQTKKHAETDISYVTAAEKEALCEHVPSPTVRNELVMRLLWQTGMRSVELRNLEFDDIDRDERRIEVWSNKSKAWRSVFYQPSLDVLMDQWLDGGYRDAYIPAEHSPYVFVTERSEQLHKSTVTDKIVKPAAEAAGIQEVMYEDQSGRERYRVTPHSLRHGHAVHALKSGIDIRTVQKHLGHSSLDMTMRYLQLIDDDVKDGYQRFGSSA